LNFDPAYVGGTITIPASAIPGSLLSLVGISSTPGSPVNLHLDAGVTFSDFPSAASSLSLTNLSVNDHGTTPPLASISGADVPFFTVTMEGSNWYRNNTGTVAFAITQGAEATLVMTQSELGSGGAFMALDSGQGSSIGATLEASVIGVFALQGTDA